MKDVNRTTEAPDDRLGRLAKDMTDLFDMLDTEGVKMALMLSDYINHKSMVVLSNYDSDGEAAGDMFQHLAAIFEANGRQLLMVPIGHD